MLIPARRLAWLLLFSVLCALISFFTSSGLLWLRLSSFSIDDVSLFFQRYDVKIAGLRAGVHGVSLTHFLKTGVFWIDAPVSGPTAEVVGPVVLSEPSVWLQALCIICGFCVFFIGNVCLFYVMCIRYGRLISEAFLLLLKCMRQVDWRSPYQLLCTLCRSAHYTAVTVLYIWSHVPSRERKVIISVAAALGCIISFRTGLGRGRLLCLLPLGATAGIYYCLLMFLTPANSTLVATYVGDYIAIVWALCVLLRHYRVTSHPTWKFVLRHESTSRSIHEMSCLLDLLLAIALIRSVSAIPFVGSFLVRQCYVHHILCFTSVLMMLHCFVVQYIDTDAVSSPLSRLKSVIILWIDAIVHFTVGWPNIASSRVGGQERVGGVLSTICNRLSAIMHLLPDSGVVFHSKIRGLGTVLRWIKIVPHLLLLLLPSFVSRLYFEYLTLLAPSIRCVLLPANCSFKSQTVVLLYFILADFVRFVVGLITMSFLPLKGLASIAFAALMDTLILYIDTVPRGSEHAHVE